MGPAHVALAWRQVACVCVLAWPPVPLTGGVRVRAWQSRKKGVLIRARGDSSSVPSAAHGRLATTGLLLRVVMDLEGFVFLRWTGRTLKLNPKIQYRILETSDGTDRRDGSRCSTASGRERALRLRVLRGQAEEKRTGKGGCPQR